MVLFFIWTDTQLINCINTKCNYLREESADLVVYKRGRISEDLLEIVCGEQVFSNIYVIELPDFYKENEVSKMDRYHFITLHIRLKKYFYSQIKEKIGKRKYEKFLVASFWSETLGIYKYIRRYNQNIYIEIVEEGMANYSGPKNWIYRAAPSSPLKAFVREVYYCGGLGVEARKRVHCLYLYRPELAGRYQNKAAKKLPIIKESNGIIFRIFEKWLGKVDYSIYTKCKVIFISDAPNAKTDPFILLNHLIQAMPDVLNRSLVVKLHPLWSQREEGIRMNDEGVIVDSRSIPIENILFHCNIDNKVLIVNHSSVLLYLKCMLDKEPNTIFTYRMKPYCEKRLIGRFDFFSEKLKGVFSNPEKLIIPNNLREFQAAMKVICERIM